MSKPFRVGIIGAGGIAGGVHVPGWKKLAGVEIVAVADVNESRAKAMAEKEGIPHAFADYHDLLALELDAVDICTPNRVHAPAVIAAANAGKHILCEKPLATTTAEVREMGEAADRAGVKLMTAQHHRFGNSAQAIKRWALAGNVGEVYHARVRAMRRNLLPTSPGFIDINLSGGGPVMDIGIHALDTCLWLMNFPTPTAVVGTTKVNFAKGSEIPGLWGEWDRDLFSVEDFAAAFIQFDTGASMVLEAAWLGHQVANEEFSCEVMGSKGSAIWPSTEFATVQNGTFIQGTLTNSKNIKQPHAEEIRVFHEAVVNDLPSPVPWTETIKAIAILEGIYASQETGQRIDLAGKLAGV